MAPGDENITKLYKYRPLVSTKARMCRSPRIDENTLRLIRDREIYFPSPSILNDPFDSKLVYDTSATPAEMRAYFQSKGLSAARISAVLAKIASGQLPLSSFIPKQDPDIMRIFCAARANDNILMWSHYAREHTGVCVGFNITHYANSLCLKICDGYVRPVNATLDPTLLPFSKVAYNNRRPAPYNIFKGNSANIQPFLLTKNDLWQYENEYRICLFTKLIIKNPIVVDTSTISEIIFGARSSKALEIGVLKIIEGNPNKGSNIRILKCSLSTTTYTVNIVPY